MRAAVPVNLASEPFQRDRPVKIAYLVGAVVLGGILATQVAVGGVERGQRAELQASIDKVQKQLSALAAQRQQVEQEIQDPKNAEAAEYALFLNNLLLRKGISWTRIFDDLDQVIPYNVRLIAVRPQVNLDNQIQLDMTVAAEQPQPAVQMFMNLEASPLFSAPAVTTLIPPTQSDPQFRYRVNVNYGPKI
ncbi:MAG: hypothetical protein U0Q16_20355 [Bryobacteraceae bacterium]